VEGFDEGGFRGRGGEEAQGDAVMPGNLASCSFCLFVVCALVFTSHSPSNPFIHPAFLPFLSFLLHQNPRCALQAAVFLYKQ